MDIPSTQVINRYCLFIAPSPFDVVAGRSCHIDVGLDGDFVFFRQIVRKQYVRTILHSRKGCTRRNI